MNMEMFHHQMLSQLELNLLVLEKDIEAIKRETNEQHAFLIIVPKWENDDEESSETTEYRGTLEEAMKRAIEKFCARSGSAGYVRNTDYTVCVKMPSGRLFAVPYELWYPFHKKYGEYRRSA